MSLPHCSRAGALRRCAAPVRCAAHRRSRPAHPASPPASRPRPLVQVRAVLVRLLPLERDGARAAACLLRAVQGGAHSAHAIPRALLNAADRTSRIAYATAWSRVAVRRSARRNAWNKSHAWCTTSWWYVGLPCPTRLPWASPPLGRTPVMATVTSIRAADKQARAAVVVLRWLRGRRMSLASC